MAKKYFDYNERKEQILEHIKENPGITAEEIAHDLEMTHHNACMQVLKYYRQGCLRRKGKPTIHYEITNEGIRKLNWLHENREDRARIYKLKRKLDKIQEED